MLARPVFSGSNQTSLRLGALLKRQGYLQGPAALKAFQAEVIQRLKQGATNFRKYRTATVTALGCMVYGPRAVDVKGKAPSVVMGRRNRPVAYHWQLVLARGALVVFAKAVLKYYRRESRLHRLDS